MALVAWLPALFTYLYATLMLFSDTPFRRMVNGIMNLPFKVIFVIGAAVSFATIVRLLWAGSPWWTDPSTVFIAGFFLYVVSACVWVPVIAVHLQTRKLLADNPQIAQNMPFPMDHFFMQRAPLVASLVGAIMVTITVWGAADPWTQAGLVVLCAMASFDAFVWDLLYARWLLTPTYEFSM